MVNKITSPVPPLDLVDVVNQIIDAKLEASNLKTINNQNLVGSGNITVEAVPPSNMATTDTEQTITGDKTFSGVTKAVTPASAKDNSTNIATTAWVRNHCCTTAATTSSTASKDAPAYVVTNYKSGNNWYRVWSDGWIEQGGYLAAGADSTASFLKAFTTTNYNVQVTGIDANQGYSGYIFIVNSRTKTNMHIQTLASGSTAAYVPKNWYACGY